MYMTPQGPVKKGVERGNLEGGAYSWTQKVGVLQSREKREQLAEAVCWEGTWRTHAETGVPSGGERVHLRYGKVT